MIWTYCDKCGKAVKYEPEVFETKESASRELNIRLEEHQLHLCLTCKHIFATCSGEPDFGKCVGNDNVQNCEGYDYGY